MWAFIQRFFSIHCSICSEKITETQDYKGIATAICVKCQQTLPGFSPQHIKPAVVETIEIDPKQYNQAQVIIAEDIFDQALEEQTNKQRSRIVEAPVDESELKKVIKRLAWKQSPKSEKKKTSPKPKNKK